MNRKTIFEIPIYSMSKDEFESKWKIKKATLYEKFIAHGHSAESARLGVESCFYPRWLWEYNQIIGYIKIYLTRDDVNFDLYCSLSKRYGIDRKTRHFIENWSINGSHFRIGEKTNSEVRTEIRSWLRTIHNEYLKGKFYIDYSVFDNTIDFLDIRGIVNTL